MNKVVIFSPNRFSLYTTTVAALLIARDVHISTIFVRNLLNPGRFASEIRRDGKRLFYKIWQKMILRQAAYGPGKGETILDLRKKHAITQRKVEDFREKYSIPVIHCGSLNDSIVLNGLKRIQPDLVVFTGGGLIRQDVLENSGQGVLNCHMGMLPEYRGMDVVEWPLLRGRFDQVGITVHFMDRGVDTGDILRIIPIPPLAGESITNLRHRIEPIMCQTLVESCVEFLDGKISRIPQDKEAGRQYFKMHPRLAAIASRKLIQPMLKGSELK